MLTPEERALITDMKDRLIELHVEGISAARVRVADVGREECSDEPLLALSVIPSNGELTSQGLRP